MSWSKIIASYLVIAQLVLAPVIGYAQSAEVDVNKKGQLTAYGQESVDAYLKLAKEKGFVGKVDLRNKRVLITTSDGQKVVLAIPLSDEKSLLEYSPKTLNQKLTEEMVRVRAANAGAWSHSVSNFLPQSAMFFLVLGGMVAIQLLNDYASDPVGMKRHIEHQLSLVGQMAFFMFMYSQGVTSNVLSLWIKKPSLGLPIAMLGMTVGSAVQTYFSQVAADPHIRRCVASVFKGQKIESNDHPCEGAYKYFIRDKKIFEAPGIVSLLGAFVINTTARAALTTTLKLVGFNIGAWISPGGISMKFVRLLVSASDIAAFTLVQMKLEHFAAKLLTNYYDGKELVDINDLLVGFIEEQKASQWRADTKDFKNTLKYFSNKMGEWRTANLSEAFMANQAWIEFLNNLTAMYTATEDFYGTYLDHLKSKDSFIDRPYPLFGVTPQGLVAGHEGSYLTHPKQIQFAQIATTNDMAAWIEENIKSGYYQNIGLSKSQKDIIAKVQQGLASDDLSTKAKALLELNAAIQKYVKFGLAKNRYAESAGGAEFGRELNKIYSMLGAPQPLLERGRGFASSILLSPSKIETIKPANPEKSSGRFKTPKIEDYLVVQMMCGPDFSKGENVVSVIKGFPAKFSPPAIALDDPEKENLCKGSFLSSFPSDRIYNMPSPNYHTAPDFLRARLNPEVTADFASWWKKGTEEQMKKSYKEFSASYKDVLSKLFNGLNQSKNNPWNRGFVSNGVIQASFQEMRLYSLILGEMLKDAYKAKNKTDLPASYFSNKPEPKLTTNAVEYMQMSKKPLLGLLGRGSAYDFTSLMGTPAKTEVYSLKIQKELELLFDQLNGLVQRAKTHSVKSEEYEQKKQDIEKKLSEFSTLLGINKEINGKNTEIPSLNTLKKMSPAYEKLSKFGPFLDPNESKPEPGIVKLGDDQKALAVTCLELLQGVAQELSVYGHMAAAATFETEN